jgi:hypothetical protein
MPSENTSKTFNSTIVTKTTLFSGAVIQSQSVVNRTTVTTARISTSTPKWNSPKRPVPSPMNGFSYSRTEVDQGYGYKLEKVTSSPTDPRRTETFGVQCDQSPTTTGIPTSEANALDRIAVNDLLLRIKNQRTNLGEVFAEREKTAASVASRALQIYELLRHLRRGDYVGAARAVGIDAPAHAGARFAKKWRRNRSKALANGWLELQYGWLPLVNDVYGSVEALAEAFNKNGARIRAVSVQRREGTVSVPPLLNPPYYRIDEFRRWSYLVKYVCWFRREQSLSANLATVGITNPALLAWELLPYSFIVDWFYPIGNYVSTFDALNGVVFDSGCRTTMSRSDSRMDETFGPQSIGNASANGFTFAEKHTVSVTRTLLGSFPAARFPIPVFPEGISVKHMLNAIGLLGQLRH